MWSQIALSIQSGDIYMITMLGLAWVGIMVIVERWIMLQFVYNLDFKKFIINFKKLVLAEDIDRATNLCKRASKTSLPQISLRALEAAESDPSSVKGIIEEEVIEFLPRIEARMQMLPALATIVLLIGVLGTVEHLWSTFHAIDILDTAEKQTALSSGIAASLGHASFGLLICTLLVASQHLLRSMALKLSEKMHHGVSVLNNLLVPSATMGYVAAGYAPTAMMPTQEAITYDEPAKHNEAEAEIPVAAQQESIEDAAIEDIKDEEEII